MPATASNVKPAPLHTALRSAGALCSLSLGRRRSTRACCPRAPCRAGCSRRRRQAEGSALARGLFPSACARGATCELQPPTPSQRRVSRAAQALSWEETQHSKLLRARAVSRWLRSAHTLKVITLPAKGLSPSARARGAECRRRPPTPSQRRWYSTAHARRRSLARCLRGGGAALELPLRARRAAVVVVGPHAKSSHCAGEWAFSFGTSPWCDVPSAASNSKPPPLVSHGARAPALARSLSLGSRRTTRASFARAPCRGGCGWPTR